MTTSTTELDYSKIAAAVEIADDDALPSPIRRQRKDNPFIPVVEAASSDHKRRVLPGRFSLVPFEGRKGSCEALAVMSQLHRAARQLDVPITMRRFDQQGDSVRLTFKVEKQKAKGTAKKS
jgi:hypothetical protein